MYVGHAAIALAIKSRAPDTRMVPLLVACYGPDWLELILMIPRTREGMAIYTHSLPALLIGATLAAALYSVIARQPGAMALFIGWLLHWPADFITGTKPILGLNTLVGLDLYHLPAADMAIESVLIVLGCTLYARRFAGKTSQRGVVVALGGLLLVVQLALMTNLAAIDGRVWKPSLAIPR